MAPKPTQPRLADIDGKKLAKEVHDKVFEFIATRAMDIGATVIGDGQGPGDGMPAPSTLRFTVQLLTGYAQRGRSATDWPDDGCCQDALIEVMSALYSCAGDRGTFGGGAFDLPDEVDATDEIGVVMLAANARQTVMLGQAVRVKELAALAGVHPERVRELIRAGEIAALPNNSIPSKEAKRWLGARGVAGFDE